MIKRRDHCKGKPYISDRVDSGELFYVEQSQMQFNNYDYDYNLNTG